MKPVISLERGCWSDVNYSPKHGSILGGMVCRQVGGWLSEAAEHHDRPRSSSALYRNKKPPLIGRICPIKNVRQRKPVEASGFFFFSSRRRHTRLQGDWSSDVCSSD